MPMVTFGDASKTLITEYPDKETLFFKQKY